MSEPLSARDSERLLRGIPAVDRLLAAGPVAELLAAHSRPRVLAALRAELEALRAALRTPESDAAPEGDGATGAELLTPAAIAARVASRLEEEARPSYRRVINATGVVLHTGLGRAPLADAAVAALAATAGHAQRLELDLESGRRGGRDRGCADLLVRLLGCEAATVVNNNAAATLLILAALARGRGVAVSRGELVEIGGSYRIPDVLRESGARLVEVGTTNRTRIDDYRAALDDDSAELGLILKVHTSNYRIVGFTEETAIAELAALGRARGVAVVHDLGSGCLVDLPAAGEPDPRASLAAGADLVCFSGDKLLGGPQAGIVAGAAAAVARCRAHPLFRAVRPGRLIYTALEATLRLYLDGDDAARAALPALARLAADPAALRPRAEALAAALAALPGIAVEVVACRSQAGSGALPARPIPSVGVRVKPSSELDLELDLETLAAALRRGEPPLLVRRRDDGLLLDVRTLDDRDTESVVEAFRAVISSRS